MRRWLGIFGLVGGLSWAAKAVYDWLVLERQVNTGYPPSDPSDYIRFIIPLLCLGGLYELYLRYGKSVGKSIIALSIGLFLAAGFQFSEAYSFDAKIPYGLLFLLPGLLFLFGGAIALSIKVKKIKSIPRFIYRITSALLVSTCLFVFSPLLHGLIENEIQTVLTVIFNVIIGLSFACIGGFFINKQNDRSRSIPF